VNFNKKGMACISDKAACSTMLRFEYFMLLELIEFATAHALRFPC
jgi:hypothetical protein